MGKSDVQGAADPAVLEGADVVAAGADPKAPAPNEPKGLPPVAGAAGLFAPPPNRPPPPVPKPAPPKGEGFGASPVGCEGVVVDAPLALLEAVVPNDPNPLPPAAAPPPNNDPPLGAGVVELGVVLAPPNDGVVPVPAFPQFPNVLPPGAGAAPAGVPRGVVDPAGACPNAPPPKSGLTGVLEPPPNRFEPPPKAEGVPAGVEDAPPGVAGGCPKILAGAPVPDALFALLLLNAFPPPNAPKPLALKDIAAVVD